MSGYTLFQPDCPVKLNQNECPFDVPEELKREIVDEALASNWGRYPEFVPGEVKAAIGKRHGLGPEHILIGNGSNELIQAIFQATGLSGRCSRAARADLRGLRPSWAGSRVPRSGRYTSSGT